MVALVTVSVNLIYGNLILVIITSRGKLIYNCPYCLEDVYAKVLVNIEIRVQVLIMNVFCVEELILSRVEIKVWFERENFR